MSLAASILHDPEIVFLDEPTAGVTPVARARFWALIRNLAAQGKTIFVTTHYMDEAEQCERIALMRTGQIIALDTPKNLKQQNFPDQIYELNPKEKGSYSRMDRLRNHPELEFFEPYGLRFHAAFKKTPEAEQFKEDLKREFHIQKIDASLEDVFIKMIEEKG